MSDQNSAGIARSETRSFLTSFRLMWKVLQDGLYRHRRQLLVVYIISMIGWMAILSEPYFISLLLDRALPTRSFPLFFRYAGAFFFCLIVHMVCAFGRSFYTARAVEGIFFELRSRLMASVLNKTANFHLSYETGDLSTRISNDTETLSLYFYERILWMVTSALMIVGCVVFLLAWNFYLGLFTFLSLPCYAALLWITRGPLARAAMSARRKLSGQNGVMLDLLDGVDDIRFYQQAQPATRRYRSAAEDFTRANIRAVRINDWASAGNEIWSEFLSFMPFLLGGLLICLQIGTLTLGVLVAYNIYLVNVMVALTQFMAGMTCLARAEPLFRRIDEILAAPEEPRPEVRDMERWPDNLRIEFRNVSYHYDGRKPVLKDFNLTVEPGAKIALMGPSGSGKTTLLNLLTRKIAPQKGEIRLGGTNIAQYSLALYLQHFAYVSQRSHLFGITLRENIAMGWYHIPRDVIVDAARRVHLHETLDALPDGYDTVIGGRQHGLSGGQIQQVLLARALVHEAAVILLDEFTSALDRATEEKILDTLFDNFPQATVICATHSEAVARRFEQVVDLHKQ